MDMVFSGKKYTWSNNSGINKRIWKRINIGLINNNWVETMPQTTITPLPFTVSDQCHLLLEIINYEVIHNKNFKFLNCQVDSLNFSRIVKACWDREVNGNSMWRFNHKMKSLSNSLSQWSKEEFGDIFKTLRVFDGKFEETKETFIQNNSVTNRENINKINAKYI